MAKIIKVTIPQPCHEDWNKMTPKEKGRYCDACEKVVVDMTKLTDHEIFNLVDSGSKICGRFRNDQLDRPMEARTPLRFKKSHWAIAASLLVGLSFLASCESNNEKEHVVGDVAPVELDSKGITGDTLKSCGGETDQSIGQEVGEVAVEKIESKGDIAVEEIVVATSGEVVPVVIKDDSVSKNK